MPSEKTVKSESFEEVIDQKPVVEFPPSRGTPGPSSSSRTILKESRRNRSENPPSLSNVYAQLKMQGERTDRALELYRNQSDVQSKSLTDQGEVLKKQADTLMQQADTLKKQADTLKQHSDTLKQQTDASKQQCDLLDKHSQALTKLFDDQQRLQNHVETEFGRQSLTFEQHERKLNVIEGRLDMLCKERGGDNNAGPSNFRRITRRQAARIEQEASIRTKVIYQKVDCHYCGRTLSSSYIRHHVPKCAVVRRGQ